MGKEQDLLHAAKNGNVAQIERILGQRNRRSGIHRYVLAGTEEDQNLSTLRVCACRCQFSSTRYLCLLTCSFISRNVSPNFQDDMGYTALHYSSLNGHK